jgi:AcrR family transcriptional regulator
MKSLEARSPKNNSLSKKHTEVIKDLEILLEKGIPELTMLEIAAKLKISLRTLYEIAPSKENLILYTVNNILNKIGKKAQIKIENIHSPFQKLEIYLKTVNKAVGPKFDIYIKDLNKIKSSKDMIDYHEAYITSFIEKLLIESIAAKEIKEIDTSAYAILLGGIGRDFASKKNKKKILKSPEETANSITDVILAAIKLEQ